MDDKLLRYSAEGDHERVALLLDKGANPNVTDEYGYTPLLLAASEGKTELARLLITRGANVNARASSGWTAVLWASSMGYAGNGAVACGKWSGFGSSGSIRGDCVDESLPSRSLGGGQSIA